MNWGYKIAIVYSVFVVGILFMVYKSSTQNFDLVTEDYYAKELKFQEQIDAVKRTGALSDTLQYTVKDGTLLLNFPTDFKGKEIKGEMHLYYAADKSKDVMKQFTAAGNTANISLPAANKGAHHLIITWQVEGKDYYYDENIFL